MAIKQIRLVKVANFCYLVGDEGSKTGALIDPAIETDRFLDLRYSVLSIKGI